MTDNKEIAEDPYAYFFVNHEALVSGRLDDEDFCEYFDEAGRALLLLADRKGGPAEKLRAAELVARDHLEYGGGGCLLALIESARRDLLRR